MKAPDKVTFEELAAIADTAASTADSRAREAGIKVAGLSVGQRKLRKGKSGQVKAETGSLSSPFDLRHDRN